MPGRNLTAAGNLCDDPSQCLRVPAMACCRHSSKMHKAVTQADHTSSPSCKIPFSLQTLSPAPYWPAVCS